MNFDRGKEMFFSLLRTIKLGFLFNILHGFHYPIVNSHCFLKACKCLYSIVVGWGYGDSKLVLLCGTSRLSQRHGTVFASQAQCHTTKCKLFRLFKRAQQ